MEATNISIKQSSSVSINVETLWFIVKGSWLRVASAWSLPRLYRKELRLARAVSKVIDAHPTLSNICLWLMGIGIMVEIFLFA